MSTRALRLQMAKTLEQRMEELVALYGDVPRGARRLQDYEAKHHQDIWVQRLLGEGIACHYVLGYQLGDKWWTFCFDRREEASNANDEELWVVEAYGSDGRSWRRSFLYAPISMQWTRAPADPVCGIRFNDESAWT
jgi:hypothetical protein